MPASYEKLGIRFEYPDNWRLDEEEARASRNAVTVYTPGGAFWSVSIQPASADPAELAAAAVETLRAEYHDLDVEKANEMIEGWNLRGYEVNFYCLDLTNTAQIRAVQTPLGVYVILMQAEDREFEQLSPVFRAMTTSLLRQSL